MGSIDSMYHVLFVEASIVLYNARQEGNESIGEY